VLGHQKGKKIFFFLGGAQKEKSRNLITLPAGAPADCPLGNEQGVSVSFSCKPNSGPGAGETTPTSADRVPIASCRVDRTEAGGFTLTLFGQGFKEGTILKIGDVTPKKLRFKDFD